MDIYQHFRKDEQIFIEQTLDWVRQVNTQYAPYLTSFLNPRQIYIAKSVIGQFDEIDFKTYGGFEGAEQKRLLIYPPYFEPVKKDFELILFEIDYPTKFAELSHGQILGSIMGTGLSRSNLGDIFTDGHRWQFILDKKMVNFIKLNLLKIGNVGIQLEEKTIDEKIESSNDWEEKELILASLRIDLVLARALNMSRNRAKKLINDQKIKVNWIEIERPDIELEQHDMISVRGHGRIRMEEQLGTTRKENRIVKVSMIHRDN